MDSEFSVVAAAKRFSGSGTRPHEYAGGSAIAVIAA